MEMHSQRSLYEIHGISAPPRRQSRWSRIARRAINRLLAVLTRLTEAIQAELAARRAIEELAGMNDHMLRDLGITRGEIESEVRRPRVNVGTDDGPVLSNDTGQSYPALPMISSPDLTIEGGPEAAITETALMAIAAKRVPERVRLPARGFDLVRVAGAPSPILGASRTAAVGGKRLLAGDLAVRSSLR
jgi:uncharacterized protein YjiS (DUF1127 family)